MSRGFARGLAALAAVLLSLAPLRASAADSGEFGLGDNAEKQACRAVERLEGAASDVGVDVYCGAWEQPSGRLTATPASNRARALTALQGVCNGPQTVLTSPDFDELRQVACQKVTGEGENARRYGLIARRGSLVMTGSAYPSDWSALVQAARVLGGAAKRTAPPTGDVASTPGMREIQSLYPSGPPGQGAEFNYELLRRRAYEHNMMGNFGAAERDFEDLLRAQDVISPEDIEGRAELLAEIGLNLSNARRFAEASDFFGRAEDQATAARGRLLLTKIMNYRALDQLNRKHYTTALDLAVAANQAREGGRGDTGAVISTSDARQVDRPVAGSRRNLLFQLEETTPEERRMVLSAQGSYIAGVAARTLRRPDAQRYLDEASAGLIQASVAPGWLQAAIANEKAELRLTGGDFRGAVTDATNGLAIVRASAPQTRSEAHLLMTLVRAKAALGQTDAALADGRAATGIFSHQLEQPGMPVDVARGQLDLLLTQWEKTNDPKLAAEYFQTLALVWDGAAARSAAQLAARLALGDAGPKARAYQDAERVYRAALARRQRLALTSDPPAEAVALADRAVQDASGKFNAAEADMRQVAPTYLELLNPRVSASDLQVVLGETEGYLRLVVGADGGFGVLVTRGAIRPFRIAMTDREVDGLVSRFRKSTSMRGRRLPDFDVEAAAKLYAGLITPVAPAFAGLDRLQIDASGVLASAPFSALVETMPTGDAMRRIVDDQDYSQVAWFARRFAIANSLGPASFVRVRQTASTSPPVGRRLAAFGDFKPNPTLAASRIAHDHGLAENCEKEIAGALTLLSPLPDTATEAKGVAGALGGASSVQLGDNFTDAAFLESPDVGNADVILLATHGVLGLSSCFGEPALLTSLGATGDGLLEASKVLDRKLKARLVILSACDTAGGGQSDVAESGLAEGGEALSGLARGFLYAGASGVLATEWKVDSATAASEIQDFLKKASQNDTPLSLAMKAAQKTIYDQPETAHPFYWAAFILVGDGSVRIAAAPAPPPKIAQLTP